MRRLDLVSDCGACAALCCIATSFDASEDFGFHKAAGDRCEHLTSSCSCRIHDDLAERGFPGCASYDCYGAGQIATRDFSVESERARHQAFLTLRNVHELLWLLTEAARLCPPLDAELAAKLDEQINALDVIAASDAPALAELDLGPHEERTRGLLLRVGTALGGRPRSTAERRIPAGNPLVPSSRLRRRPPQT